MFLNFCFAKSSLMYDRSFSLIMMFVLHGMTRPDSRTVFTRPNDGWTGLCIRVWVEMTFLRSMASEL